MKTKLLTLLALLFIVTVSARADENNLEITKINNTTWQFQMPEKDVELTVKFDDGTTAIVSIKEKAVKIVKWYDLNGRPLRSEPTKTGVYIQNGKIVVIKK
ncbi:MAG: hypothetical protein IKO36_10260 [Bacteroidaceae bacterium]|nr:hypothetical protein [Bacteroidaceae bacterium]